MEIHELGQLKLFFTMSISADGSKRARGISDIMHAELCFDARLAHRVVITGNRRGREKLAFLDW
jgi:hypothetical protein